MAIETLLGGGHHNITYDAETIYWKVINEENLPRGLSELEKELKLFEEPERNQKALSHIINKYTMGGKITATFPSLIKADITDEEKKSGLEFCSDRGIHIGGIGYMDPARMGSYYCGKCDKWYEGAPKIEVLIGDEFEVLEKQIGDVRGRCGTCDEVVIFGCPVWEGQNPDVKYISKDYSGKFIRPTPESIEKLLADIRETADKKGKFDSKASERATNWSKLINYDLGNKLKELEEFSTKKDIEIYEQNLEQTINDIDYVMDNDWGGNLRIPYEEYDKDPNYAQLIDDIRKLIEYIPKIKVPDDPAVKEKLSFILERYKKDILEGDLSEIESKKAELEKQAADLNAKLASLPKI